MAFTPNEELLTALAAQAVKLGMRDGKNGKYKRMTVFQLMEIMGIGDFSYATELRRIYGAAIRMRLILEREQIREEVRMTKARNVLPSEVCQAYALIEQIHRLFEGRDPSIIGAVLADVLSTWLAGHMIEGNQKATDKLRRGMLEFHIKRVRELIPVNERAILEKEARNATFN
jgi:hypothetical protein